MTRTCVITGKKVVTGISTSHSNQKTKRWIRPNVQYRKLRNPATGRFVKVWISTNGLRTMKKWDREGKAYDLAALKAECIK